MSYEVRSLELLHEPSRTVSSLPPLLFIHGGFHGAWCWADNFMPWFAERGYDCYAISYREHGGSPRSDQSQQWRLADYVDDVKWAADQLPRRPILVGHSLGGTIAQKLSASGNYPAMALLAPSPIGGSNRAALRMFATHPRAMTRAFIKRDLTYALPAFLGFFTFGDLPDQERTSLAKRCDGKTSFRAAVDAMMLDCPKPQPLNIPVVVLSGTRDWSIPQYKNERLARAYQGDHIVVPAAHDMMCDTQWEAAARSLLAWFEEVLPD